MLENGLEKDELSFGGRETFTPWWRREKAGVETRNRISITSSRKVAMYSALESISRYENDKRITVQITERQPIFEPQDGAVERAMIEACEDAWKKASILSSACGREVGKAIEITEHKRDVRGAGSYGDYDFGDYAAVSVGAPAAAAILEEPAEPAARLVGNKRTIFVKYLIKYELQKI